MDYEIAGVLHPAIQGLFLSVILLCLGSALFFRFLPVKMQPRQQVVVYHFMLFFLSIFFSFIVASTAIIIGYALASVLTGVLYVIGYYSLRQGLIIRKTGVVTYFYRSKWLWLHVAAFTVTMFTLLETISRDEYRRIFFLTANLIVITAFTLPKVIRNRLRPTRGEQVAKSALWIMLVLMCICLLALLLAKDFQSYLSIAVPIQAFNLHIVVLSLCALLLSDNIHIHYDNSMTDALTGVPNRRHFMQKSKASLNSLQLQHLRAIARTGVQAAMIVADIDYFKKVNDRYGHEIGDKAIIAFAKTLASEVPETANMGRLGGEEFVIFLPNTSASEAQRIAETMRDKTREIRVEISQQKPLGITASFGIAVFCIDDASIEDFLRAADRAMYFAKDSGRDTISHYDTSDLDSI